MEGQDFGWALAEMRKGLTVRRHGWLDAYLCLSTTRRLDGLTIGKPSFAFVFLDIPDPWEPDGCDLLATDWEYAP